MFSRPVAFPCPTVICAPIKIIGGAGKVITGAVGSGIGTVISAALTALVQVFTGSAKENLEITIKAVVSTPVADLKGKAFVEVYRSLFGLIVILIILGVLTSMLVNGIRRNRDSSVITPAFSGLKIFIVGAVLPGLVTFAIFAVQYCSRIWLHAFETTQWKSNVQNFPSISNLMSELFLTIGSFLLRFILLLEIIPIQLSVPLFTLLSILVAVSFIIRDDIGLIGRITLGFLLTGITIQLILAITLVLGGLVLGATAHSALTQDFGVFVLLLFATASPMFIWFAWTRRIKSWVENRQKFDGGEVTLKQDVPPAQQKADAQKGVNAQLMAFQKGSTSDSLAKDAALIGVGAGLDHAAAGAAKKVATATSPLLGAGLMYAHHRYVKPRVAPKHRTNPTGGTQPGASPMPPTAPSSPPPAARPPYAGPAPQAPPAPRPPQEPSSQPPDQIPKDWGQS